jgi:hypothetical protein
MRLSQDAEFCTHLSTTLHESYLICLAQEANIFKFEGVHPVVYMEKHNTN